MTDLTEGAITKLYAVPLGAFTRERDALAKTLTQSNRAAEARAVRQLRRPSAALWATNQLAHRDPDRLDAFLDGIAQVRKTQLRDPRAAAEGLAQQRRELQHLVRRAGQLLAKDGARATPDTERRISDTLLGAAVDRDRADELRRGRLTQELAAPGFEVLTGVGRADHLRLLSGGKAARANDRPSQKDARRARLEPDQGRGREEAVRREAEAAQREAAAQRKREEAAAREREEAAVRQREMAERRAAVEQAELEARELNARLAAARQRLAEARRAAKMASRASRRRPSS